MSVWTWRKWGKVTGGKRSTLTSTRAWDGGPIVLVSESDSAPRGEGWALNLCSGWGYKQARGVVNVYYCGRSKKTIVIIN